MTAFRPLGFWLKLLDELIDGDLDRILQPFGLVRRDWQILNLLSRAPHSRRDLERELAAFGDGGPTVATRVEGLAATGWVEERESGDVTLTDDGRLRVEDVRTAVSAARQTMSAGIERSDYETTISTLKTMCHNLGWNSEL